MRWPWVARWRYEAAKEDVENANGRWRKAEDQIAYWKRLYNEVNDHLAAAEERRANQFGELKSEIERLKSGIDAAINTLRPGEAE